MADRIEYATIELPRMLRDRLRRHLVHPRQPMHDLVEDMLDFWLDSGGYDGRPRSRL